MLANFHSNKKGVLNYKYMLVRVSNFTNVKCLFKIQNKLIYDWPTYAQPVFSLKQFDNPGFDKIPDWDSTWGQYHKEQAVFG